MITTEAWFYGFDTALMIICMGVWVVGHPGVTLGRELGGSHLLRKEPLPVDVVDVVAVVDEVPDEQVQAEVKPLDA